uniref:G-protein coupled receptors family 1 profile domain-containing protein n=1 Tax=Acrobeloides nanus TaxID=290746 RepID=A0A914EFJ2_9BILA
MTGQPYTGEDMMDQRGPMQYRIRNPVVCGITTLVVPSLSQYNFYATIVISLVILLVYGATWVVAKTKNQ